MLYDKTNLPEDVKMYLREICEDKELNDVFYDCDIEIYDKDRVKGLKRKPGWKILWDMERRSSQKAARTGAGSPSALPCLPSGF